MIKKLAVSAALLAASFTSEANAGTFDFSFAGPGVSGNIEVTYGSATDSKYPDAFEVTGIIGTFSDSNNGLNIMNAAVGPLVAINPVDPELGNDLAPHDFSRFAVASGLPMTSHGNLSYTNLFWPGGSPSTASSYLNHGGFLDIYGLLFQIDGGLVVNLWSNGDVSPNGDGHIDYGVAVVTPETTSDYVGGGVSVVPEPSSFALLGMALAGTLAWRRRPVGGRVQS